MPRTAGAKVASILRYQNLDLCPPQLPPTPFANSNSIAKSDRTASTRHYCPRPNTAILVRRKPRRSLHLDRSLPSLPSIRCLGRTTHASWKLCVALVERECHSLADSWSPRVLFTRIFFSSEVRRLRCAKPYRPSTVRLNLAPFVHIAILDRIQCLRTV